MERFEKSLVFELRTVECVGPLFVQFLTSVNKLLNGATEGSNGVVGDDEDESLSIDDNNEAYLRGLDPKEWKRQDHYAVLGIGELRQEATANMIKSAYRHQVLRHHPDKRKSKGEVVNREDDYFTCITRAWETLGEPTKRRSYDSVDPFFDDNLPTISEVSRKNFFELFDKYFVLNSRWSERQPTPRLGGPNDSRDDVNKFYSFWYDFSSWREYSYEDEEGKETGQDRDERRWIEKQNRAVRGKKKKEEMARIRNLVDMAYNADPRIVQFKQMDREKKEAYKKAKADVVRLKVEEEQRAVRELAEREAKVKEEVRKLEEAKQKALKSEREAVKRATKKARKALRDLCKENEYYSGSTGSELIKHMELVEKWCGALGSKELDELVTSLLAGGRGEFLARVVEEELRVKLELAKISGSGKQLNGGISNRWEAAPWTPEDISLLIKAVNLFPAGTAQRWEVVANFMNQHGKTDKALVTAKEVLSKAKELQNNEEYNAALKRAANQKAFQNFEQTKTSSPVEVVEVSQREASGVAAALPWTSDEQKLLEQALKTYSSSAEERWEKIAAVVKTRSKKDCILRYKELVQMVKAKKQATRSAS